MTDQVQGAFKQPFEEQIAFFRQKINLPTDRYDDIKRSQHDRAFIVAGAKKADLLTDLKEAVDKAIADGETLADFRKRFDSIVKKRGWVGWTGSDSASGRAWRTRIIYNTNLRTSHAAGRWAQMRDPQVLKAFPIWMYVHTSLDNPRLNHKAWDRLAIDANHPFWQTNYPPNGWECKCRVRAMNLRQLKRLGKTKPDEPPPDASYGVDADWRYAAGATWQPDMNKYPKQIRNDFSKSLVKEGIKLAVTNGKSNS